MLDRLRVHLTRMTYQFITAISGWDGDGDGIAAGDGDVELAVLKKLLLISFMV